ncbi:M20/M25/M40 family metallo-hydrolase [Tatumella sp. JGM118]|uniref:M20/M25/M40 family metallo-hydrolase n=1 Tax=Tatumella sp. JGM118 TaxID=2799796 RepID=UPI001BB0D7CB|nr:M20/M25/M40 family metallo-hydrolase [Tatumella sp. JGM118]MBS0909536.1 M20/M25/M40 family metallo-hydrolase [Tatumella sp. JGM118]
MKKQDAINYIMEYYENGEFLKILSQAVNMRTLSQAEENQTDLYAYINEFMIPLLTNMDFVCKSYENPVSGKPPFMVGHRFEDEKLPTILLYGHGDVIYGMDERWGDGRSPWSISSEDNKIYGRGTADNKGQHLINILSLKSIIELKKGSIGLNIKILLEMGEESGSPGIIDFCSENKKNLAADVFIASDGPRIAANIPTLYLGSRGVFNFCMEVNLRDKDFHSGNWGGIIKDPGIILSNAISCIVDHHGKIKIQELKPKEIPEDVKSSLSSIEIRPSVSNSSPEIFEQWGEPGLSLSEKLYGWNSFSVLALYSGNPVTPTHAISGSAKAYCHIRYVTESDPLKFLPAIRNTLKKEGVDDITLYEDKSHFMQATRLNQNNSWVTRAKKSMEDSLGKKITILPNLGGSIPNAAFSDVLGLPTLWIPHSYPSCAQHAPDEHLLTTIIQEGLQIMTGLFWDLAE